MAVKSEFSHKFLTNEQAEKSDRYIYARATLARALYHYKYSYEFKDMTAIKKRSLSPAYNVV